MAQQTFYSEDTVRLKSDHSRIGIVDRTLANIESHTLDPLGETVGGEIQCGEGIDPKAYIDFLQSGVPPRGTVLVTWVFSSGAQGSVHDPILIQEAALELVDRALLFGDVVKRTTPDAMSGTIIQASTKVSLLQPLRWPSSPIDSQDDPVRQTTGNYTPNHADTTSLICDVPVDELAWPNEIERDQIVIYKDWVGVVDEIEEDIYVRLNNNSVVIPENCSMMRTSEDDSCQVNDRVKCIKAALRRGKWIYGTYNADVKPEALIVDIRPRSLTVDWLVCNRPLDHGGPPPYVPDELEREDLESPEFHVYDRRKVPSLEARQAHTFDFVPPRANLEVAIGDRVRFRDITAAVQKYSNLPNSATTTTTSLSRIPRTETLGFDINVFTILETKTYVDILWQDGTLTKSVATTELCPFLDLDNEEEVWPGELVITKAERKGDSDYIWPLETGIVQYVNAQKRFAYVKWFDKSNLGFSRDHPSFLHQKSIMGKLAEIVCEVSLYDITTVPNFARRLGDLVAIIPSPLTENLLSRKSKDFPGIEDVRFAIGGKVATRYWDYDFGNSEPLNETDENPHSQRVGPHTWIGEIVELGLDGLLTVRLAALDPARDIRVPWQCTVIAHSNDNDDDDDDDDDDDFPGSDPEIYSDGLSITSSRERWQDYAYTQNTHFPEIWRDEQGNEIILHTDDWSTDNDMNDSEVDNEEDKGDGDVVESSDEGDYNDPDSDSSSHSSQSAPKEDDDDKDEDEDDSDDNRDNQMEDSEMKDSHFSTHNPDFQRAPSSSRPFLDSVSPNVDSSGFEAFDYSSMFQNDHIKGTLNDVDRSSEPESFLILDGSPPKDHWFSSRKDAPGSKGLRRIQQQYQMLRESLPPGAYVRTWESKSNLMRLLLLGPVGTPYELAPFFFDLYMDSSFPDTPPEVYFHSWTQGDGPCNPNLYEDGKVCLSLLGTWPGDDSNETWNPGKSSILQVIVSLLGLVLVKEPYFNEAGFEARVGTAESQIPSAQYSERAYFRTRRFIGRALSKQVSGFVEVVDKLYLGVAAPNSPRLLHRAIESGIRVIERSKTSISGSGRIDPPYRISAGAVVPLSRELDKLISVLSDYDSESDASKLTAELDRVKKLPSL